MDYDNDKTFSEKSKRHIDKLTIADEDYFLNELLGLATEETDLIDEYFVDASEGKKSVLDKLQKAIKQNPNNPVYREVQVHYSLAIGENMKALSLLQELVEDFPDYLFARLLLAEVLFAQSSTDEFPSLIGNEPDLQKIFPERNKFTAVEITRYYAIWARYAIQIDEEEYAKLGVEVVQQVSENEPLVTALLLQYLDYMMTKEGIELPKHPEDLLVSGTLKNERSFDESRQTDVEPIFKHPEIYMLYQKSVFDISDEELESIKNLTYETLVKDIITIMEDCVNRFLYFADILEGAEGVEDSFVETYDFPIHALLIAADLEDERFVPYILDILRQGEELVEFWFGDRSTEVVPLALSSTAVNHFDTLREFVEEPFVYYYSKNLVARSVIHMAADNPDLIPRAKQWLLDILEFFIEKVDNPDISDADAYSVISSHTLKFKDSECFVEPIATLYDLNMLHPGIMGPETKVLNLLKNRNFKIEFQGVISGDLLQKYEKARDAWTYEIEDDFDFLPPLKNDDKIIGKPVSPERDLYKDVGRNDPCPCGSGKKFKKCCLN